MHIKAFYRRFASSNEQGNLFQALRNLSLVDDAKSMFGPMHVEWVTWPPVGVDAVCEA